MTKVIITGASGFIAQHIVKALVEGGYDVVGTVRSESKGEHLKGLFGEKLQYEIVKDMIDEGAFDETLKKHSDAQYIIHSACPFHFDTTDPEKDLLIPAIKGTENVFKSIKTHGGQVEKVVITSSDAAIYNAEDEQNAALSFDESSWNNISYEDASKDAVEAYYGAKSFAEKFAWKFMETEKPKFTLTAVNPVYVFGPQVDPKVAKGDKLNTSNQIIADLMKLKSIDDMEAFKGGFVDVRDVVKAHIQGLENDETIGQRLFVTGGKFSSQMMLDILNQHYPKLGLPEGNFGSGPADISTLAESNNDKTKEILKFEFATLEKIIVDTADQILN